MPRGYTWYLDVYNEAGETVRAIGTSASCREVMYGDWRNSIFQEVTIPGSRFTQTRHSYEFIGGPGARYVFGARFEAPSLPVALAAHRFADDALARLRTVLEPPTVLIDLEPLRNEIFHVKLTLAGTMQQLEFYSYWLLLALRVGLAAPRTTRECTTFEQALLLLSKCYVFDFDFYDVRMVPDVFYNAANALQSYIVWRHLEDLPIPEQGNITRHSGLFGKMLTEKLQDFYASVYRNVGTIHERLSYANQSQRESIIAEYVCPRCQEYRVTCSCPQEVNQPQRQEETRNKLAAGLRNAAR